MLAADPSKVGMPGEVLGGGARLFVLTGGAARRGEVCVLEDEAADKHSSRSSRSRCPADQPLQPPRSERTLQPTLLRPRCRCLHAPRSAACRRWARWGRATTTPKFRWAGDGRG